ncbi:MAG: tetratricopeptide repeat protein [Thermodesulfobacteriota bacterium]
MKFFLLVFLTLALSGCMSAKNGAGLLAEQASEAGSGQGQELAEKTSLKTSLNASEQLQFRLDYARLLIKDGRLADAERLLDALRRDEEIAPQVYPLLAQVFELQSKWDQALLAWQEAVKRSPEPKDTKLTASLARVALSCEEYGLAEEIYRDWLRLSGEKGDKLHVTALNNLGFNYLLQHDYELAALHLDQALAMDPLNKKAQANSLLLTEMRARAENSDSP